MPTNAPRAGPSCRGPTRHVQQAAKPTESRSRATVALPVDELTARRELRSWAAAAVWLNQQGYAAAVPGYLADPLRRSGLVVWAAAGRTAA